MPTLIVVGNSEGERRCDAKCYNATGDECTCCCNGVNHGKGLADAIKTTREIAEKIVGKPVLENILQTSMKI